MIKSLGLLLLIFALMLFTIVSVVTAPVENFDWIRNIDRENVGALKLVLFLICAVALYMSSKNE